MNKSMVLEYLIKECDLHEGDTLICTESFSSHFIVNNEYILYNLVDNLGVKLGVISDRGNQKTLTSSKFKLLKRKKEIKEEHPHCALIIKWAGGAIIQYKYEVDWQYCGNNKPSWNPDTEYRVKPKEYTDTEMLDYMCRFFYTKREKVSEAMNSE